MAENFEGQVDTRKSSSTDNQEEDLQVRVAWAYHKENLTQQEIADQFSLSRSKVNRLLRRAAERDIVNIEISHPRANLLSIERELTEKYDLEDSVVVPHVSNEDNLKKLLGEAGAFYLRHRSSTFDSLGLSLGTTLQCVADSFEPTKQQLSRDIRVVTLHGNLTGNIAATPYSIGITFSEKLQADFYNVWGPTIAESEESAQQFRSEPWIKEVLEMAAQAELMLLGIGALRTSATLFQELNYLSEDEINFLEQQGAVGDTLGQFFDINGNLVDSKLRDRMISVPLDDLRNRSGTIGIGGGEHKYKGILGALRGRFLRVLITDEKIARKLLNEGSLS